MGRRVALADLNYSNFDCPNSGYGDVYAQAVEEGITMASKSQERLTLLGKLAVHNSFTSSPEESNEVQ